MSGEVLRPCPICGKKVSIARTDNEVGERWWFITRGTYKTTRCNCRLFLESEKFTCGWNDDYSLECRAKLIDRWNTRAERGTLTAEQVREAIERNFGKVAVIDDGGEKVEWREGWVCNVGFNLQAIADELNAKLGSGTCHSTTDSSAWCFVCSECGKSFPRNKLHLAHNHGEINYCPNCGKRVER